MFVELAALLKSCQKISITVFPASEGKLKLAVVPTPSANADDALTTPLYLVGTPAELDQGFTSAIGAYTNAHIELADQVASTTAILGDAKVASSTKAIKALSSSSKKDGKDKNAFSSDADDDDEKEDGDLSGETGLLDSTTSKVAVETQGDDLLSILQGGKA